MREDPGYLSNAVEYEAANAVAAALHFMPPGVFVVQSETPPPIISRGSTVHPKFVVFVVVPDDEHQTWIDRHGAALLALRQVVPDSHNVELRRYVEGEKVDP